MSLSDTGADSRYWAGKKLLNLVIEKQTKGILHHEH